ncbi:MAG TPA: fibronectin type III domain-containing protein [Baekduia sp.]
MLVTAVAALAVAVPAASATITQAPLTIVQSGSDVTFTIAAPGESPTPDRMISLLVAPADAGLETFSYTAVEGSGEGASQTTASTAACQAINGSAATDVPQFETHYTEGTGFVLTVPSSDLPATFDAKAVTLDDFETDTCAPDDTNVGIATTMAGAQRFPAPPVAPPVVAPVVVAPTPPPVVPVAPVAPKPAPVVTKDGIKSDWVVAGKPVAAPKAAEVSSVTAHSATLTLPKAPKGATIRVYRRVAGTKTFRVIKVTTKHGKVTMSGLKPHTRYEVKLVAVNKAGKQTNASKSVTVKTPKH